MHKDRKIWDTNRSMVRKPRLGYSFCMGCDRALVGDGQKCPVCGYRNEPKRNKKE